MLVVVIVKVKVILILQGVYITPFPIYCGCLRYVYYFQIEGRGQLGGKYSLDDR